MKNFMILEAKIILKEHNFRFSRQHICTSSEFKHFTNYIAQI